jgi:hypothetical protein
MPVYSNVKLTAQPISRLPLGSQRALLCISLFSTFGFSLDFLPFPKFQSSPPRIPHRKLQMDAHVHHILQWPLLPLNLRYIRPPPFHSYDLECNE